MKFISLIMNEWMDGSEILDIFTSTSMVETSLTMTKYWSKDLEISEQELKLSSEHREAPCVTEVWF